MTCLVAKSLELRERGRVGWPPSGKVQSPPAPGRANPGTDGRSRPLMYITPEEGQWWPIAKVM